MITIGGRAAIRLSPAVQAALTALAAMDPDQLSANLALLNQLSTMNPSTIALLVRNADNTASTQELPLNTAGSFLVAIDGNGNVTFSPAPLVTPIRTNTLTLDATVAVGTVKTITMDVAMPDANYQVVPLMNGLAGGFALVPGSQTTTTYQVKVTGLIVGTVAAIAIHNT